MSMIAVPLEKSTSVVGNDTLRDFAPWPDRRRQELIKQAANLL
ncbi:MAG TPA: hypothetical protein VL461_03555 [Dictyobacter sp.]|nr:hypothetical protein [Dictyobacter sp.]